MRRAAILLLFALPAFAAEPSKFTLAQSGGSADPLTVLGPASVCADQQIALWSGASNTLLQCSVLTVADTTGNITGPAGGFSIIGGTGATDTLTLDSTSNATNGAVKVAAGNSFRLMLLDTDAGNYESLNFTASAGAFDVRPATAGAGSDVIALTLAGEGPTATLTLDGSDDVAGSVTVTKEGNVVLYGDTYLRRDSAGAISLTDYPVSAYGDLSVRALVASGGISTSSLLNLTGGASAIEIEGSVADGFETSLVATNPTADRTITLPDATGTVVLNVRVVTPDIDGETTTLANSATTWTNTGDGDGEAITLLNDPGIGVQYCFAVDVAQTITVAPSTGETLYYGTDNCVASLTSNAIGSTLCVTAITGGSGAKWFTLSDTGSWTCND